MNRCSLSGHSSIARSNSVSASASRGAQARGLATVDGLEMLIGQAALAFELFFGAAPARQHDAELRTLLTPDRAREQAS